MLLGLAFLAFGAPVADVFFNPHFFRHADAPRAEMIGNLPTLLPAFAGAGFGLGLLQAIAIFALASRRHIECFVLGACGVIYTGFIFGACHLLQLLPTCMFGGALVSLMIVLFAGVVRYARTHP